MKAYLLLLNLLLPIVTTISIDRKEGIEQFNERLAKIAPNLIYLGNVGYKGWYAFHDKVSQAIAKENCVNFGMKLAVIDSQQELEFIANAATEPLYHIGGLFLTQPSSLRWSTGLRELNPDFKVLQLVDNLVMDKGLKILRSSTAAYPYLCFMSLVKMVNEVEAGMIVEWSGSEEPVEKTDFTNQTTAGLTYVGRYGYKSFYHDDTLVNWFTAKENCQKIGMTFARFDSQDELEWIVPLLVGRGDAIWIDGEIKQGSQYWYWISNGNPLNAGIATTEHPWGILLRPSYRSLQIRYKLYTFPYICFISSTS